MGQLHVYGDFEYEGYTYRLEREEGWRQMQLHRLDADGEIVSTGVISWSDWTGGDAINLLGPMGWTSPASAEGAFRLAMKLHEEAS